VAIERLVDRLKLESRDVVHGGRWRRRKRTGVEEREKKANVISSEYQFQPELFERALEGIIREISSLDPAKAHDQRTMAGILRQYPRPGGGFFSKSELVQGFRHLAQRANWPFEEAEFLQRVRMKPVRTASGVAPVTVLTEPFPCPGRCIFCPSDVRMPKSYLADEPGAQRAAQHRFDPYRQTMSRLLTLYNTGHAVDKIELIILGGTWSFYPEEYQIWFIERCFDAMNEFQLAASGDQPWNDLPEVAFEEIEAEVDGLALEQDFQDNNYNRVISEFLSEEEAETRLRGRARPTWESLAAAQRENETARVRGIGMSIETRPDHISEEEVVRVRRLGATKVQIGYQSLSDEVLRLNRRGHDVAATRRAMDLLRQAGFKVHAHWMPNLYGSSPAADAEDYGRIFDDPAFRPDELKIYPCSLIESAELMSYYQDGRWSPYGNEELVDLLVHCLEETPEYCRLTRVIRDIPGTDIVVGNRTTNLREVAEAELESRGGRGVDIRRREIRFADLDPEALTERSVRYASSIGEEVFLQSVTPDDRLAAFLRLSLPASEVFVDEIARSAMIREVHVYGRLVAVGERGEGASQHVGLGRRLIARAAEIAREQGYEDLAVISSVGTREYYRGLGFSDGTLYQHLDLGAAEVAVV